MKKIILFLMVCGPHVLLHGFNDIQGNTSLMQAIIQGNVGHAKRLIEQKQSIRDNNDLGQNALMLAAKHKEYELMRLLVCAGCPVNCRDFQGGCLWDYISLSPLDDQARLSQDYYALKFLIDSGLLIDEGCAEWTPLMHACFEGQIKQVRLLLEQGANPHVLTSRGISALICALQTREYQAVELLLAHGAQIEWRTHSSFDIIALAVLYGNASIVRSLLSRMKERSIGDIKRAYDLALLFDHVVLIKIFHEYCPEIEVDLPTHLKNRESLSDHVTRHEVFERAVANNDMSMVRTSMIDRLDQLKINQAIFLALRNSNCEMIDFLSAHHADVNSINDQGLTPLMVACGILNATMVRSLLANGANPSLIIDGSTALFSTIDGSTTWLVNGKDVSGNTELVAYQTQIMQNEIIPLLLNHGAQANIKNRRGFTPLMEAVKKGCNNVIPLLLNAGADIHWVDGDGNTALHLACINNNENAVRILLSLGASPSRTNRFGNTPMRSIERNGTLSAEVKSQLIALLKKYGV